MANSAPTLGRVVTADQRAQLLFDGVAGFGVKLHRWVPREVAGAEQFFRRFAWLFRSLLARRVWWVVADVLRGGTASFFLSAGQCGACAALLWVGLVLALAFCVGAAALQPRGVMSVVLVADGMSTLATYALVISIYHSRSRSLCGPVSTGLTVIVAANVALTELAAGALRLPPTVVRVPVTSLVYFGLSLPLWSRVFRPSREAS